MAYPPLSRRNVEYALGDKDDYSTFLAQIEQDVEIKERSAMEVSCFTIPAQPRSAQEALKPYVSPIR